jgi:hypothetical protein
VAASRAFRTRPVCEFPAGADLLRRTRHYHLATGVAAFRARINHVVGTLDHVEVMLDNQQRVAVSARRLRPTRSRSTSARCSPVVGAAKR